MSGADVAFLSSVRGGHDPSNALSVSEQQALFQFVINGGLAILVTDNDSFGPDAVASNASLIQMFGLTSAGTSGGSDQLNFHTVNWASNGPFGDVASLLYGWSGHYSSLGAYAQSVGNSAAFNACGCAIIERNELGVGSGPVIFFSDSTWYFDAFITDGAIVIKNILSTLKTVTGTVELQSFEGDLNDRVVEVSVRHSGGSEIAVHQAVLDANGEYSILINLPNGSYDIAMKTSHWLRKAVLNINVGESGAAGVDAVLVNGDCDHDNEVTLIDFSQVAYSFGSIEGDSNWSSEADLDGDGEVTLVDFGILSTNFGQAGDE